LAAAEALAVARLALVERGARVQERASRPARALQSAQAQPVELVFLREDLVFPQAFQQDVARQALLDHPNSSYKITNAARGLRIFGRASRL
jgi:hypothetical protein